MIIPVQTGVVKNWLADRGFGFITSLDGADVFCHRRSLPRGMQALEPGTKVSFEVESTVKGASAVCVRVVSGTDEVTERVGGDVLTEEEFRIEFGHAAERLLSRARRHGWVR